MVENEGDEHELQLALDLNKRMERIKLLDNEFENVQDTLNELYCEDAGRGVG